MTSQSFNERKARAAEEMQIFDQLPACVREALNSARGSVRASSALAALLRGVECWKIVDTINKSVYVHTKEPKPESNQT